MFKPAGRIRLKGGCCINSMIGLCVTQQNFKVLLSFALLVRKRLNKQEGFIGPSVFLMTFRNPVK